MNWSTRVTDSAEKLVPWLENIANNLKNHAQDVFNAPLLLRSMWQSLKPHVAAPNEQIEAFERQLAFDDMLRSSVTGEVASVTGDVVSGVVTRYLIKHYPTGSLKSNGRSDYPDIYDSVADYSLLPAFKKIRAKSDENVYGASLKNKKAPRPVRVPDGLEIKTCKTRVQVDCHHPHIGLHLVVLYEISHRMFTVIDIRVAFLSVSDYREAARNTTATTVKYTFGGERFVSILRNL